MRVIIPDRIHELADLQAPYIFTIMKQNSMN